MHLLLNLRDMTVISGSTVGQQRDELKEASSVKMLNIQSTMERVMDVRVSARGTVAKFLWFLIEIMSFASIHSQRCDEVKVISV